MRYIIDYIRKQAFIILNNAQTRTLAKQLHEKQNKLIIRTITNKQ